MKNLICVLFLAIVGFLLAGYFLNWYDLSGLDSTSGRHRLQIEVDTQKIRDDLDRGQARIQETIQRVQDGPEKDETDK